MNCQQKYNYKRVKILNTAALSSISFSLFIDVFMNFFILLFKDILLSVLEYKEKELGTYEFNGEDST